MIREFQDRDIEAIRRIHADSGLPVNCFPNTKDPKYVVSMVAEEQGRVVQAAFVKLVGEGYVLVDHRHNTPQERWATLSDLIASGLRESSQHVDQVSCWVPPALEASFGKRLENLGFILSPWKNWTANLL